MEFLDKELPGVVRDAQSGRRHVDVLAKVFRPDGTELWVLVHVEFQNRPEPGFAARMYRYYRRLSDRYDRPGASLAVLADTRPKWRPNAYEAELWGCRLRFEFPVCKLMDLEIATPERPANPVAFVVAAH